MPETNDSVPQFQTAEFQDQQSGESCCICHQPLTGTYYRINGARACASCSERVRNQKPHDSHAAFSRALLFGLGGALLGLILYSAIGILLHVEIGYVSLAVGYLVGKGMMKGSSNIGGRRYQWTAVLLTYAAVSLSAVPIGIAQYAHSAQVRRAKAQSSISAPTADSQVAPTNNSTSGEPQAKKIAAPALMKLLGILLLYGLASPVLGLMGHPFNGMIGLFILFIGVRIAWQITAGRALPAIEGPY